MRDAFIAKLSELAQTDSRIMLITGDLGFKVFDSYRANFPRQFLNIGVAEQNMAGVAAGLALEGRIVFMYSIANFSTLRCLEQIRNDICYHQANVKVISVGSGFSYGPLGVSHHATEDISIMRALPEICVLAPGDDWETKELTQALYSRPGPGYLRLDRSSCENLSTADKNNFTLGKVRILRQGNDACFVTTGGLVAEVLGAAENLAEARIQCCVIHVPTIKPLQIERILPIAQNCPLMLSVEEHTVLGGLGSALAEQLMEFGVIPKQFIRLGLKDEFASIVGSQGYLRKHYGLDAPSLTSLVAQLLKLERSSFNRAIG